MRFAVAAPQRTVYAFEIEGGEFGLSPFENSTSGKRPINRYDTREELESAALARNCEIVWQVN